MGENYSGIEDGVGGKGVGQEGRVEWREIQSRLCCPNLRSNAGVRQDTKIQGNRGWVGQVSRSAYQLGITSSCNGCSEKPLAPFVAPLR